jgi:hypothetical protein
VIRRNPAIAVVKGAVVYEGDLFEYEEGSQRVFRHKPAFLSDKIIGAYSFIKFAAIDDWEVDYQPVWRIEKVRAISRAKEKGPWVDNYDEMCIKTVLRHHAKTLPLRPEERQAVQADDDQFEFDPFGKKTLPIRPAQIGAGKKEEAAPEPEAETAVQNQHNIPDDAGERKPDVGTDDPDEIPEAKLERLCQKHDIASVEVIAALVEHKVPVNDAMETGAFADMPTAAILAAINSWEKIVFTVNKLRARKEAK